MIRENQIKKALREGKAATIVGGLHTPEIIDYLGNFGFEGIFIDTEHSPTDWQMISHMSIACDLWGLDSIVRVQHNESSLISRTLDVGANGIFVPHINTKTDAEQAVSAAKYYPIGTRGTSASRHTYGMELKRYYAKANDEVVVICLLEELQAIQNLDDLLTVDGIDVFMIGPGDLAQTMGLAGQMGHPEVRKVVEGAIKTIMDAGRIAGTTGQTDNIGDLYEMGARFFLTNWSDWMSQGARNYLAKAKELGS